MKYLFVVVISKNSHGKELHDMLEENGVTGKLFQPATLRQSFMDSNIEPIPQFGTLRQMTASEFDPNEIFCGVVGEEALEKAKKLVREYTDNFKKTAESMLAVRLDFAEGKNF